ncbi:hypothetical protein CTRI78_v007083 [Colletotrichum trifolii]|uniref:Uncharacterized protein n=1 Tax=Colletotrichum trifolii TaxID=5466 RepID=A0A4R8RA28_COLTR|nr:hypothetical protein CTRI78_v007083 [Colletotrichum trifolii]
MANTINFFRRAIFFLFVVSTLAITTPVTQYYNITREGAAVIRPRVNQCVDYHCDARKNVRTTIGARCTTVCQTNCAYLVSNTDVGQIKTCSLNENEKVVAGGSFSPSSYIDASCGCKYCLCDCPYSIDNIVKKDIPSCYPNLLCAIAAAFTPGWHVTSHYTSPVYSC